MRKIFGLAVLLAIVAVLTIAVVPALAQSSHNKIDCADQPVIGGPDNPDTHNTKGTSTIPDSNPTIRWDPADIVPGKVHVPACQPD